MSRITSPSFEDRLVAVNMRPSGFDYLRLVLAICVVLSHTVNVSYGMDYTLSFLNTPFRSFVALILPLFFALSGFLVAGSLYRCKTLISFLGLRVIRLIPALAVETVLAALVIGTIYTTLPLGRYFSDPQFGHYFLNILGDIHFSLPGVFIGNPDSNIVNSQLWTLPYEMICYASIASLALLRIVRNPRLFVLVLLALNAAILAHELVRPDSHARAILSGLALVQCFLYGIAFYFYRASIPWNRGLFLISTAITLALLSPPLRHWGDFVAPVFATYMTVYLGLLQPRRIGFLFSGDYSYGIFLYGFPIQQAVIAWMGPGGYSWYVNFAISMPIILAVAAFSWWCIEKPALQLRKTLLRLEDLTMEIARRIPGGSVLLPTPLPKDGVADKASA